MLSEDIKIKFSGFEPTQDMKSALYYLLNQLHLKSPHKSFLSVTFNMTNGIIEGAVKITSQAENFVAKASDVEIVDVGQKLLDKLSGQLEKWKSLRCL